jgi:hypothetical protein
MKMNGKNKEETKKNFANDNLRRESANKVDEKTLDDELLEKEFGRQKIDEDLPDKHNLEKVGISNAKNSRNQLDKRKKKPFQDGVQVVREIREERE